MGLTVRCSPNTIPTAVKSLTEDMKKEVDKIYKFGTFVNLTTTAVGNRDFLVWTYRSLILNQTVSAYT
jgi:hypothetical protein